MLFLVAALFAATLPGGVPGAENAADTTVKICMQDVLVDFESTADGSALEKGDTVGSSVRLPGGIKVEARPSGRGRHRKSLGGMIFDTREVSGNEFDAAINPKHKNILIVSAEENDHQDPGNAGQGGLLTFVFDSPVFLKSMKLIDIQEGAKITINTLSGNAKEIVTIPAGAKENDNVMKVEISASDVTSYSVKVNGSGAIDDVLVGVPVDCRPEISTDVSMLAGVASSDDCPGEKKKISAIMGTYASFCINVTNTGNVPLSDVLVEDVELHLVETIPLLLVGEAVIFIVVQEVTADMSNEAISAGIFDGDKVVDTDKSFVTAISPSPAPSSIGDAFPTKLNPFISVTNSVVSGEEKADGCLEGDDKPRVTRFFSGEFATFCFKVANTGDVPLKNVVVKNPVLGFGPTVIPMLMPGEMKVFSSTETASVDATNILMATGTPSFPDGSPLPASFQPVSDMDESSVQVL